VPPELREREVSVRALIPIWEAARKKGVDPQAAGRRDWPPVEHLTQPRRRISWAAYHRFLTNVGQVLSDGELVALGASAVSSPLLRTLLLPGRLLYTVPEFYLWSSAPDGPASHLFVAHEGGMDQVAPGTCAFAP
jgi:hypothetical protein